MGEKRIYILSTGRAGSTFLYKILSQSSSEMDIGHQQGGSRVINVFGNLPFNNSLYLKLLNALFVFFRRGIPPFSTVDPLLSVSLFKLFKNTNSEIKIVHLVRDPKDFVTSFMNWKNQSIRKKILHYFIPFWNPVPLFHGVKFREWIKMTKFEKFCWVWNYKNSLFKSIDIESNSYFLLRLEDLTINESKREETLANLFTFLNIPANEKSKINLTNKINKSDNKSFPSWENWTQEQNRILRKHCNYLASKLGYDIHS